VNTFFLRNELDVSFEIYVESLFIYSMNTGYLVLRTEIVCYASCENSHLVNIFSSTSKVRGCACMIYLFWLAPVRAHARSPGDGDGPRRDELLLGAAVLAVCRCLRRSPGCERRSSWAP